MEITNAKTRIERSSTKAYIEYSTNGSLIWKNDFIIEIVTNSKRYGTLKAENLWRSRCLIYTYQISKNVFILVYLIL